MMENDAQSTATTYSLAHKAKQIAEKSKGDHAAVVVECIVNAIPYVGGSLSALLTGYIPQSREKRVIDFAEAVAKEFERLEAKLTEDISQKVNTDEFAYMFTRVFTDVIYEYQQEKLEAYRNVLVNSLLEVDVQAAVQEAFLNRLENLTTLHMKLVPWFGEPSSVNALLAKAKQMGTEVPTGFVSIGIVLSQLTGIDQNILKGLIHDLDVQNITNNLAGTLATTMDASAIQLHSRLTEHGKEFVRFVSQQ